MAERAHGRAQERATCPGSERDHALFVAFAPVAAPRYVCAVVVEHGGARRRRLGGRGADRARHPARGAAARSRAPRPPTQPLGAAGAAAPAAEPRRWTMSPLDSRRPRADARARSCASINWGLVLLICADRRRRLRHALFGGRRQHASPGPSRQMVALRASALVLMLAVGAGRHPLLAALRLPALRRRACCCWSRSRSRGVIGMGAQRWIDLGVMQLQPSELMKIALVLALARYFHGLRRRGRRPAAVA